MPRAFGAPFVGICGNLLCSRFHNCFVALGAGASSIGAFLRAWQQEIAIVAGVVIILMGLNFLGILRFSFLSREARFQARNAPASPLGAYVMGLAFAFGWTPCIGPVLGPILTLAGGSSTVGEGALLLATYSLGLGIPFLIAALFPAHSCGFFHVSACISARWRKQWARFWSLQVSCS